MTHKRSVEVCVIGGGAAGLVVAEIIAAAGRSVLVLERGPLRRGARRGRDVPFESVGHPIGSSERVGRIALGGDGRVWGRAVVEFDPVDFEARAWRPGWPVSHEDMAPFYEAARRRLGVPPARPTTETVGDVVFKPIDRSPVQFGSILGDFEVVLNTRVVEIVARGARVTAVRAVRPDGEMVVSAGTFVLAAGGIASPALLASSQTGESELTGRFFADHPYIQIPMVLPPGAPPPDEIHGGDLFGSSQALLVLSEETRRELDLPGAAAALHPWRDPDLWGRRSVREWQRLNWGWRFREVPPRPVGALGSGIAGLPAVIRAARARSGRGRADLRIALESIPDRDGRIAPGSPAPPRVDWRVPNGLHRSVEPFLAGLSHWAEEHGWGPLQFGDSGWPKRVEHGAHLMGATRMGHDSATGVVDRDCRVFGTDNLYVSGPSVFPSYSYANPMATVVALATRLGRHIAAI